MVSSRWKKVFRDLTVNKTRTLLVVLSIAVGVFAVGAVSGARVILSNDLTAQYNTANAASATVFASSIDEQFVRSIGRMPGIRHAEGRSTTLLRVRLDGGTRSNLIIHTLESFDAVAVNRVRYVDGAFVPPLRQIVVERGTLSLFEKSIGDSITVELPDGKTRELVVAGTVFDITAPPVRFANFGSAYMTEETAAWLGFQKNYGQMRIVVSDNPYDRAHIQEVVDQIKERVEDSGRMFFGSDISQDPGKHIADGQIQAMLLILNVLGALSLFLSAFLVTNSIAAVMAQHVRQIGIMKSIGGRQSQIAVQYIVMVIALGILSISVAVPFGLIGAQGLAGYVAGLLNFDVITRGVPTSVLLIEIAVGLIVPVAAALAPIVNGARMTVREAISSTGVSQSAKPEAAGSPLWSFLPRPLLLSLRNTFRRKGRLALTLGTLTLASAIFISIFSVRSALARSLQESLGYWNYDIEVTFKNAHAEDKIKHELLNVDGVTRVETWNTGGARRVRENGGEGRVMSIIAPSMPTELLQPVLISGRWLLDGDENAIVINTEVLADEPDLKIGDTLRLAFGERTFEFTIVGLVQSALTGQVRNPRAAYVTQIGYRDILTVGRQVSRAVIVSREHSAGSRMQLARDIEAHFRKVNMPVDTTETINERRDQISFQFDLLITFLLIMAVILAIVGGLGLAGTMSINVFERTREIGVMRAIGGGSGTIRMIVIVEGLLIGLISWAAGAVFAAPVSYGLNIAVGEAFMRRALPFAYSIEGLLIWLGACLLVSGVASFLPAWNASRLTVREVLAYE